MTQNKRTAKYHHAAYAYLVIGIVYLIVFFITMPPHDFSGIMEDFVSEYLPFLSGPLEGIDYNILVNGFSLAGGVLFLGLTYFIYKEYRFFVVILSVIYAFRFLLAGIAFFSEDMYVSVKYVLPLIAITFYMLVRAAWDLKP